MCWCGFNACNCTTETQQTVWPAIIYNTSSLLCWVALFFSWVGLTSLFWGWFGRSGLLLKASTVAVFLQVKWFIMVYTLYLAFLMHFVSNCTPLTEVCMWDNLRPHNFNFQHEFFWGDQHAHFACAASGTKYAVPRASLASKFAKNWRPVWTSFDQLTFKILTCHRYHRWSRYCILSYILIHILFIQL